METILLDNSLDVYLTAYKRFLKLLYQQGDFKLCLEKACNLIDFYPEDMYAYEWICKIYCEHYNTTQKDCLNSLNKDVEFYASKLLELNEKSSLGLFVKAINLYHLQQYVAAREMLYQIQLLDGNNNNALELLALTEMQLEAYGLAEELWHKLKANDSFELALCLSYSEDENKLQEAVKIFKTKESSVDIKHALARLETLNNIFKYLFDNLLVF